MKNTKETATLNGEEVEILHVDSTEYGTLATIAFEDGREDQVPLRALFF
jgi:hypothetical protein